MHRVVVYIISGTTALLSIRNLLIVRFVALLLQDPWGILISNGEFTSFSGGFGPDVADHAQIVVTKKWVSMCVFLNRVFGCVCVRARLRVDFSPI